MVVHKAVHALTNHTQTLLDGLFEGAADGHDLAHALHAGTQFVVDAVELGEVPTRNLADDVIEGGLEEGAGGLGNGVLELEQSITQS